MLLIVTELFSNVSFEDEPRVPVLKKTCVYSKIQKPEGYRTYFIYEDAVSNKVSIFSKNDSKIYTTKEEMTKYRLYNCEKLLNIIMELGED